MTRGFGGFGCFFAIALLVPVHARAQVAPAAPTPAPTSGRFEVALHARSTRASARAEQAAWLSVTLPLDKLALPRVAQRSPASPSNGAVPASGTSPPPPAPSPSPSPSPAPAPPPFTFQQLRVLSEFSRAATRVALAVVGAAAERRRLDALSSRARTSSLLPELRLRAVRNTDQALRWAPTGDDPYRVTQAEGAGIILEASAVFRLDRLLFAHEELAVERARQDASEQRSKLEARVQAALLGLFRARERACAEPDDDAKATLERLLTLEQFQELDNLTAGWFSTEAPRLGVAVWGFSEAVLGVCSAPQPPPTPPATNPVASLENSE
jgi:hypothetical protein